MTASGGGVVGMLERAADIGYETVVQIAADVSAVAAKGYDAVSETVKKGVESPYFQRAVVEPYQHVKGDVKKVGAAIGEAAKDVDGQLDKMALTDPDVVGFIDGTVEAWTGTKKERMNQSQPYTEGVMVGKAVSFGVAGAMLFGNRYMKMIASIPALVRLVPYVAEKFQAATSTVQARYAGARPTDKPAD